MNRFDSSLGYSLTALFVIAVTLGGCPTTGGDASSENGNVNDNSQVEDDVNTAPVASAGDDQIVPSGELVVLNALVTSDPDGDRLQFIWGQIGGLPTVTLQDGFSSAPRFFAPDVSAATVLTFRLTVGDGQAIAIDDVLVTITP